LDYSQKSKLTIPELKEELRTLLLDSVKKRLISDVPLGAFLSGGVDSSIIVGLMSKLRRSSIKTFSIGFDSEEYQSELKYARMISQKYNTDHYEEILNVDNLLDLLPDLVWYMDEPFADHSMVPTFLVSRLAHQYVKVVLTGDGADENFGGYPRPYKFAKRLTRYESVPEFIRKGFEKTTFLSLRTAMQIAPDSDHKRKMFRLLDMLDSNGMERIMALESIFTNPLKRKIFSAYFKEQIDGESATPLLMNDFVIDGDFLESKLYLDVHNYMVDDILTKVDRMSMANSLEARVPFLDHLVVELAGKIQAKLKLYNDRTKYILKETFKDELSEVISSRKKQGFGIPIKFWGKGYLNDYMRDIITSKSAKTIELFNSKEIEKMIDLTSTGASNYSRELWSILILEIWLRRYYW